MVGQTLRQVVTSVGTIILPVDTRVYADLNKGNFLETVVGELQEGTKILWRTDRVDAEFEKVEPHFSKSPRYALAESQLFVDVGGKTVPKFQYELLSASAEKGLIDKRTLDDRLRENSIPASEIKGATEYIHAEYSALYDEVPERAKDTIHGWLNGTTVAPRDLDVLLGLGIVLDHEPFLDAYDRGKENPTDINAFWGANKFYTVLRQQMMKYFSGHNPKILMWDKAGEGTGEMPEGASDEKYGRKPGFNLTPEIGMVLREFIDYVDEEVLSAKVLEIRPIEDAKGDAASRKKPRPNLKDGAYTGEVRENMNLKSVRDVMRDREIIKGAYMGILREWLSGVQNGKYEEDSSAINDFFKRLEVSPQCMAGSMIALDPKNVNLIWLPTSASFERDLTYSEKKFSEFRDQEIRSGSIDEKLGIDRLTTYDLTDTFTALSSAVPGVFHEVAFYEFQYKITTNKLADQFSGRKRSETKELKNQARQLGKKLHSAQGRIRNFFGNNAGDLNKNVDHMLKPQIDTTLFSQLDYLQGNSSSYGSTVADYISFINKNFNTDSSSFNTFKKDIISRETARYSLQSYGLEQAFRFIDERNFVLDKEPLSSEVLTQTSRMRLDYGNNS